MGGMPGVYPLVTPLLTSHHTHEIRHGAALLGRLGQPAAIDELVPLMSHRDESVRVAGVRASGEVHAGAAAEPLREALHHPDGRTRAAAAEAIAVWRGGALALLLVTPLETERDRDAWLALVNALGRIGTAETSSALEGVARTRRSLLRRQGHSTGQRLPPPAPPGPSRAPAARGAPTRLSPPAAAAARA